jgi:hypothetical protein
LSYKQRTNYQKKDCYRIIAHESPPYDSKPPKLKKNGTRIINLNSALRKEFFERQELRCMKEQSIVKTLDPENVFAFGRAI